MLCFERLSCVWRGNSAAYSIVSMDLYIYEKTKDGEAVYDVYSRLLQDRIIFLHEEIDSEIASRIIASVLYLDKKNNQKEICVYINSVGGEAEAGLAIYDVFQFVSAPIKTICVGRACSAAADLLASGSPGKRLASPNAEIMIHSIQAELSGSNKEIQEEAERLKKFNQRSNEILSLHTGQPIAKIAKDCEKDKYMTAQEALEYGIIDKILSPKAAKLRGLVGGATKSKRKKRRRR